MQMPAPPLTGFRYNREILLREEPLMQKFLRRFSELQNIICDFMAKNILANELS